MVKPNSAMDRFFRLVSPGPDFQQEGDGCAFGYAKVDERMHADGIMDTIIASKTLPANFRYVWSVPREMNNQQFSRMIFLKASRNGGPTISRPEIEKAELADNKNAGGLELTGQFGDYDAGAWQRMTKDNISRPVAIVANGVAYTWPVVQSEISGGVFSITGPFSRSEFENLEMLLDAPALPVSLKIVSESSIP